MKKILFLALALMMSNLWAQMPHNSIRHRLYVQIDNPANAMMSVTDTIEVPQGVKLEFLLNANFTPILKTQGATLKKIAENIDGADVGMDHDDAQDGSEKIRLTKWKIEGAGRQFILQYSGTIAAAMEQSSANYQRGFTQSAGIICEKGTYLAGSTYWVPAFGNHLVIFSLTTELPGKWKNVSQGKRIFSTTQNGKHKDRWVCDKPQEEIFLIAAPFTEYTYKMSNGVLAMAFLRTPDEGLANKYLETTEQYMNMDNTMLGIYPYSKFALVENFWETGYGMPSFTLLGEKIIRFPFILHSSYPHELLHNWWGNSVYVAFDGGNWCEGTTAFMADHLIKEQHGTGEEYRRSTLQKFTNLVTSENDFPLNKFVGRYDGPSEAIGYGKALMMWQMLRRKLGDDLFLKGMKLFYKNNQFKRASYDDIRKAMETVSGLDLTDFFTQWTTRMGAPKLALKTVKTDFFGGQYRLDITLEQQQPEAVFSVDVPIAVATEKGVERMVFKMNQRIQSFQMMLKAKPLKMAVDPQYDVFRLLDPHEVPPTLSKIWGSKKNIIILPGKASKEKLACYKSFAKQWQEADDDAFEVVLDKDLKRLPTGKTAWILGFDNKFSTVITSQLVDFKTHWTADSVWINGKRMARKGNDFVLTVETSDNANAQNFFLAIDNEKAIPGLVRKLPHYGKYSYLAFTGEEPTNIAKGQWPVLKSPMVKIFDENAQNISLKETRKALGELKPVFSAKRMMETIKYLSSDAMKGRGLGTPELDEASRYIAKKFEDAGLQPLGKSYFQTFTHHFADKGDLKLTNVIAMIPGTDPVLKNNPVVVSAHYDHLGLGWPDVHHGDEGKIHHGADDNASGVSLVLELAKTMGKTAKPKRTIIFLVCSGEEAGLIGSRYFVKHRKEWIKGEVFADVNLDTDGSLFDKKILVLNANSAKEWPFIFMGTDYTTGIKTQVIEKQLDASDQMAFIENGIPAVQLFTGATENYHRPSDTYDKIDADGLVKVAVVTKEVLDYLADRTDPMHYKGEAKPAVAESSAPKTMRRVGTGSIPSFTYMGKGIKISKIEANSAAEKAKLQKGDIITAIDKIQVNSLKEYSDALKKYQPGDKVVLTILRDKKTLKIPLVLDAR